MITNINVNVFLVLQVSQPHMNETRYIRGAVARYKGFLHLIKRNKEQGIQSFVVPTYDIDLIWHTHQLHPASYTEDLFKYMGRILEHDDTDSDRSKGQKLDVGFTGTNRTFEDLFGRRYWRAGAMYKGVAPSPVRLSPYLGTDMKKEASCTQNPKLQLPSREVFEVINTTMLLCIQMLPSLTSSKDMFCLMNLPGDVGVRRRKEPARGT